MLAAATSRLAPRLARGVARAQLRALPAPGARAMSSEAAAVASEVDNPAELAGSDLKPSEVRPLPRRAPALDVAVGGRARRSGGARTETRSRT